jgi:hypothetical protein
VGGGVKISMLPAEIFPPPGGIEAARHLTPPHVIGHRTLACDVSALYALEIGIND